MKQVNVLFMAALIVIFHGVLTLLLVGEMASAGYLNHNIALNATACAATARNGATYDCDGLYDNSQAVLTSCWISPDGVNQGGTIIKLNESTRIANITVFQGDSDYDTGTYNVSLSNDNVTYSLINTSTFNGVQGGFPSYEQWANLTFANLSGWPTAQYVMINVSKDPGSSGPAGFGLCEVKIYEWDGVTEGQTPTVSSLIINASDYFNGDRIENFTVNVSNSTFSVINSTTSGGMVIAEIANITNYTVTLSSNWSGGYFNTTFNVSISGATAVTARPYQNYVTVNITQLYTRSVINGINISGGNITTTQTNTSSTQYAVLLMKPGNFTINISGKAHFNYSTSINLTSAATNYTFNFTLHNAEYNVTLMNKVSNTTITSWSLQVDAVNLTAANETFSTSTATITRVRLIQGYNFTLTPTKSAYSSFAKNFTISAATSNLTVFAQLANSLNLEIFSESQNRLFGNLTNAEANETVIVEIIGPTTLNLTTNNGTLFITDISSGDYEIRYYADSFRKRSYFLSLPANGSDDIDLFLLNNTLGTQVVATVVNEDDVALNGSIIKVLRFYPAENVFKTVEMSKANFNGEAPIFVVLNTQEYKLLVEYKGIPVFLSTETKLTSTAIRLQVVIGTGPFETVKGLQHVYATLNSVVSSDQNATFTYTFTDTGSFLTGGCLQVYKITATGETTLCDMCSTSTAATIICNINTTGAVTAQGSVNGTNNQSIVTHTISKSLINAYATFGNYGPFLALLVLLTVPMVGSFSISASIFLGIIALAVTAVTGLYVISIGAVFGLLGAGLIILFKSRSE